ncbi:MAG: 6-phospho-beta-glucosidase [Atopobiaceae bacterium]|jgi:6-phospho-beta-glucosidase|nr:6-phospho-beta-glucosidase [Atopobiaceae bacterium]MCH4181526.1 6-phospho-beta-glucosidase [Atopobiaceae bacterium]MCH4214665.1 6-phospho-beta-glucosidase [Atopobiaceae bacterium]MCI1225896.1 6-phospho-beta-glucosidase [Atopobiaceae bacterium]MCI1260473.1 6-phospho-beta-glucosidase [Atopobiaceae bacterium]
MSQDALKIATIGGGSSYTPELVEGFIKRYDSLPVRELWLVDIPEGREKLASVGALAQRMVEHAGLPMKVVLTEDRRAALDGADFVTSQIRVGRLPARILDERIPLSHGMIGQETNGAGGMFKAFRTIPVILGFVREVQELCPEAWMINFTNPSGMIEEAVLDYTDFTRAIGLCNVPINMVAGMAKVMGVDESHLTLELQGVNHFVYATDVRVDGVSVIDEAVERYANISADEALSMKNFVSLPFSPAFIRGIHAIPCPYHNYYFFTKEQLAEELEEFKEGRVRGEVVAGLEKDLFKLYENKDLDVKPKQLEKRGGARYSDAACSLINSIHNDTGDIQYVNVRNAGTIEGLPDDSAVEVASRITAGGAEPLSTGQLKPQIAGSVQMMKGFERMVVKAAVTGDRDLAVAALDMNPLCPSDALANQVVDELIKAHAAYLPQFVGKEAAAEAAARLAE